MSTAAETLKKGARVHLYLEVFGYSAPVTVLGRPDAQGICRVALDADHPWAGPDGKYAQRRVHHVMLSAHPLNR